MYIEKLKAEYKKLSEGAHGLSQGEQLARAQRMYHELWYHLGLVNPSTNGVRVNTDENGVVKLRESNRIKPQSVSLKELTEAFLGYRWRERLGINPEGNLEIAGKYHDTRLTESDAGAIGPSAFMNVTAWSGAVAGLYAAQMIDSFNNTPEYKIRSLFPDRPAAIWLGGQRLIDIFGPIAPDSLVLVKIKVTVGTAYAGPGLTSLVAEIFQQDQLSAIIGLNIDLMTPGGIRDRPRIL